MKNRVLYKCIATVEMVWLNLRQRLHCLPTNYSPLPALFPHRGTIIGLLIERISMKIIGIVLIAAGILMLVLKGFSFTQEKKVVDIGPIEINAKEKKTVAWPTYAGVIAIVAGVALVALDRKKTN